jgi:rare lipoprotein A
LKIKNGKKLLAWVILTVVFISGCARPALAETTLVASWYSVESLKKEGTWKNRKEKRMANGQMFKDENKTCATRLWPIATVLRVTNVQSYESVIVKVTDRIGKRFAAKRIDLSKSAFEKIGSLKEGLINVRVERIL